MSIHISTQPLEQSVPPAASGMRRKLNAGSDGRTKTLTIPPTSDATKTSAAVARLGTFLRRATVTKIAPYQPQDHVNTIPISITRLHL